jgi:hypothetical protein
MAKTLMAPIPGARDLMALEGRPDAIHRSGGVLPWPFWVSVAAVFVGWFPCDALTTTAGALRLHFHFFDLASLIARPARLLTGIHRGNALTIPFGMLCMAALAATFAPRFVRHPIARFGPCAPLGLMLLCGVVLYGVTSGDTFTAAPGAGSVTKSLARLGNTLAGHASAVAARHITIGLGVWLSLPAALYLAHGALRGKWLPSTFGAADTPG